MTLNFTVEPDFTNTISITDYTRSTTDGTGYLDETASDDVLTTFTRFKYTDTVTVNILLYVSSESTENVGIYYSDHSEDVDLDQIKIAVSNDGYYRVIHLVLPTYAWYEKMKDLLALEEYLYSSLYVVADGTDGKLLMKVTSDYSEVNVVPDINEIIEINPEDTTISRSDYDVFVMANIKRCYETISHRILNTYTGRCSTIDPELRFKRDFLWMTINIITYHLEWAGMEELIGLQRMHFVAAQLVIEKIKTCAGMCDDFYNTPPMLGKGCGCLKR